MESWKTSILAAARPAFALALLSACSSAPIKMECRELQARIDYGNLTGDQLRFATEELEDCRNRAHAAEEKDSSFIEGAHERFTPSDSQ
ncbi:MAG: hypothetical protein ABIW76_16260 [Fibrobacteria bacterium]